MLMYLTDEVPSTASEQNKHASREQYHTLQEECRVLRQHYQTLSDHFQTVLTDAPLSQRNDQDSAVYRHAMQDFRQSLHKHRSAMQDFRHGLHSYLNHTRNVRERLNSNTSAPQSQMRKTILLGMGNAQEAAVLLERMQHAGAHRVFVAVDWSQVLCILRNVYLDVLVLDEDVTPLPVLKLCHHLRGMQGLERLPIIIMSDSISLLLQEEQVSPNLVGLEKPIMGEALLKALAYLLSQQKCST